MNTGTIKFFNAEKGFGFILPDAGGPDVFFHVSGIHASDIVKKGDKITYDTKDGKKGLEAYNIQ